MLKQRIIVSNNCIIAWWYYNFHWMFTVMDYYLQFQASVIWYLYYTAMNWNQKAGKCFCQCKEQLYALENI